MVTAVSAQANTTFGRVPYTTGNHANLLDRDLCDQGTVDAYELAFCGDDDFHDA